MLTIEEFLRLSNRLREYYGKQIKDRFSEYTFSIKGLCMVFSPKPLILIINA